jgi:two-component system, OmpR family, phosphate regulon response regulator PhoB
MRLDTPSLAGKRILIVDDERAVRETLRMLLPSKHYTIVEANNGAEAFALFLGSKFDLVLTDFEMPFVKGNELASRIKRVAPQQPILMLTAFHHRPGADNPVDAVLSKPFDSRRLMQTMEELMGSNDDQPATLRFDTVVGSFRE